MSDIVERLRREVSRDGDIGLQQEAAAEIERLRALLEEALDPTDYVLTQSWCERTRRALACPPERSEGREGK